MKLFGYQITKDVQNVQTQDVQKNARTTANVLIEQQVYRTREDLQNFEDAVASAQNVTLPYREELNRIYDRLEDDPHFTSQWETRKMKTIQREFNLFPQGSDEPDEAATEIFKAAWFHDFMHLALDNMKRGFVFIEFGKWDGKKFTYYKDRNNKLYKPVRAVDFNHVRPEFGQLLKSPSDQDGLDIFSPPISNRTLFIGDPKKLGLLFKCAKYILFKDNCLGNWSQFAEVFGHDLRIGKTTATGKDRLQFFETLKKLSAGGFGVIDEEDMIEFAGTSRTDAYQVYNELVRYIDSNISKLIFGQDVVQDHSGRVRGTAAENITELYGDHDSKFLDGIVNDELIPKMSQMGVAGLDGRVFKWDNTENLTLTERSEIDFKISQMGKNIDEDYITETYGTVLGETQTPPTPFENAKALKNLYGNNPK